MNTWTTYSLSCSHKNSYRVRAEIYSGNGLTTDLKVLLNLGTYGHNEWRELPTPFALGPYSQTYEGLKKKSEKIVFELLRGIKLGCIHFMKCIPKLPKPSDLPQEDGDLVTFDFFVDSRKFTLHLQKYTLRLHRFESEYDVYHRLGLCLSSAGTDLLRLGHSVNEDESRSTIRGQLKNIIIGNRLLEKDFNAGEGTR